MAFVKVLMMFLKVAKTFLLLSAAWALLTLWVFPYQNGLLTALMDLQEPGTYLPGSQILPVRHMYTGIKILDKHIVTMNGLFWPALEGSRADVSLVFLEIVTQAMATCVLVTIEGLRVGNKGKWYLTSYASFVLGFMFRRKSVEADNCLVSQSLALACRISDMASLYLYGCVSISPTHLPSIPPILLSCHHPIHYPFSPSH